MGYEDDLQEKEHFDRIVRTLAYEKEKDRIPLLKIEIAKADNPRTEYKLKKMLQELIDQRNRRNRIMILSWLLVLAAVIVVGGYFLIFDQPATPQLTMPTVNVAQNSSTVESTIAQTGRAAQQSEEPVQTQSAQQQAAQQPEAQAKPKAKTITKAEFKQWIAAVWEQKHPGSNLLDPAKFKITTSMGDDKLAYAKVDAADRQIDTLDSYRVNADGQLEEDSYFQGVVPGRWIVVSDHYN